MLRANLATSTLIAPGLSAARSVPSRSLGAPLWDIAGSVPSLDLNFADQKSLVDATTGQNLITFTRASSGTYVGADGLIKTAGTDEPRFDHNPTTGESLGLLAEGQRTNLLLRSEEFDNASWTKTRMSVSANSLISPNGAQTADKLIATSVSGTHFTTNAIASSSGTYTLSAYAKAGEYNRFVIYMNDNTTGNAQATINLGTKTSTVTATGSWTNVLSSIYEVGNGWFRVSVTGTQGAGSVVNSIVYLMDDSGNSTFIGDDISGIYLWGAQLEAGAFPTSYIPTTTSAATRSADVASITGSAFSSWYRQDEGTLFCSARSLLTPSSQVVAQVINGTTALERMVFSRSGGSNNAGFGVNTSGSNQASLGASNAFINNAALLSAAYKQNDIAFTANGGSVLTDSSALLPPVDRLELGQFASAAHLNGTIARLTYWPARLSDNVLQEITR